MALAGVVASKRFPKDYLVFQRKYADLETNLREFLIFRREHRRPDETFGQKDGPLAGTKCRYCHLIHGRAILIYQLGDNHLRLISMEEHKVVETGSGRSRIRQYASAITPTDFLPFSINHPRGKPMQNAAQEEEKATQDVTEPEPQITQQEPQVAEQIKLSEEALWDEHIVRFLTDRQMLWRPRPSHDVIVLHLDQELIAPRGDVLIIDLALSRVRHLSPAQLEVQFEAAGQKATTLEEAVKVVVATPAPAVSVPAPPPSAPSDAQAPSGVQTSAGVQAPSGAQKNMPKRETPVSKIGAQLGRLLVTIAYLQATHPKIDTELVRKHLVQRDANALSPVLHSAQLKGFVRKDGSKSKSAYYYCLTAKGRQQVNNLGDWPFSSAGLVSPGMSDAA